MTTLKEGVFLLPSYFSCAQTIDEAVGKAVMAEIINESTCNMYSNNGNLIVCPDIKTDKRVEDGIDEYCAVSQEFLDRLDESEFYDLYTSKIKSAKKVIAV